MNGLEIYQNTLTADQCNQLIKLFGDDDRNAACGQLRQNANIK